MARRALALALLCWGCDAAVQPTASLEHLEVETAASLPPSLVEHLTALPFDGVTVLYDVEGPSEIRGSLELRMASGGRRRLDWNVSMPGLPSELATVSGTRIETPLGIWTSAVEGTPKLVRSPFQGLDEAYAALPEGERASVVAAIDGWKRAMRDAEGESEERYGGVPCQRERVDEREVCLWGSTGIALAYEGGTMRFVARSVATDVRHDASLFALPEGEMLDEGAPTPGTLQTLERLANGDASAVSSWAAVLPLPG